MAGRGRGREMTLPAWMTQGTMSVPGKGASGTGPASRDNSGMEKEAEEAVMLQQEMEMKETISRHR